MDFSNMLAYCEALDLHNDRAWFHENHRQYEQACADFLSLLDMLRFSIAECAPRLAPDIKYMEARDWVYRIARDMRYYKNMPPYDPSFRAYISRDRKSWLPIGYCIRIAPGNSRFGTGVWFKDTASTNLVRDYISSHAAGFESIIKKNGLPVSGEKLKKMPRGYSESDPAAEWLRFKNWDVFYSIPDSELSSTADFDRLIRSLVLKMETLRLFLLEAATLRRTEKQAMEDFYCCQSQ